MKSLEITNFKGIKGPLEIKFTTDNNPSCLNLALYSENGGGKTSIAEAIRIACLSSEIELSNIPARLVDTERMEARKSMYLGMINNPSDPKFCIKIDGTNNFESDNPNEIEIGGIAILGRNCLVPSSRIDLTQIINPTNFKVDLPIADILSDVNIELIIDEANKVLKETFKEEISLVKLSESGSFIGIRGITSSGHIAEDIDKIVNEARQNIIKIVLFGCFLSLIPANKTKNCLVVFDDIMSSLDLENRIVLSRYLSKLGKNFQVFVLTHNVGFYNLMKHVIEIENQGESWNFGSMYPDSECHEIYYSEKERSSLNALLKKYNGHIKPSDTGAINELRKLLEFQLHELGKILVLGVQEETKELIQNITSNPSQAYLCIDDNSIYTHKDLVNSIKHMVKVVPESFLRSKISKLIDRYDDSNIIPFVANTIQHLRAYQKVILHPGSHDNGNEEPVMSSKELRLTLQLMQNLDIIISRKSSSYPYFI